MNNEIHNHATAIGNDLVRRFPAVTAIDKGLMTANAIPAKDVEEIADEITELVAEILQSYLDAGSERDVTHEELGPHILEHLKGWSA